MALQRPLAWADTKANLAMFEEAMLQHKGEGIDVIVLPEMFNTGFIMEPAGTVDNGTEVLTWMQRMAATMDAAIAGSTPVQTDITTFRNRMFFVRPDGTYDYYDKRHLFHYGGEGKAYVAGNRRVISEFRGFRFLLQVCYDLRYPSWTRCHNDYDVILYSANWPVSRQLAWDILIRARAIENQAYLVAANRIGIDHKCTYKGSSAIIDFYGETMVEAEPHANADLIAEFDIEKLRHYHSKFPVAADQDNYQLVNDKLGVE